MKSEQDRASYNNEFRDLQVQLYDISNMKFNGVSMFAKTVEEEGGDAAVFGGSSQSASADHTITIFTSADGAAGSKVSVHKSVLLSALTFNTAPDQIGTSIAYNSKNNTNTNDETVAFNATFASQSNETLLNLADISVGVITQALENIAFLRAQNGGTASRLAFNAESLVTQKTNMRAALGRMVDVDIAEETTNLAKYSVLSQASASILAQANANTEIALMLLR